MSQFLDHQDKKREKIITLLMALIVWLSSYLFYSITRSFLPLVMSSFVLLPCVIKGRKFPIESRPIIYTMVSAFMLSVIPYQYFKQANIFGLIPSNFLVPLGLISAAHLCLLEQRRMVLSCFGGLIFASYMALGDLNISYKYLTRFSMTYLVCFVLSMLLFFKIMNMQAKGRFYRTCQKINWGLNTFVLIAFAAVFLLSPLMQKLSFPLMHGMSSYFSDRLSNMHHRNMGGKKSFSEENDITSGVHSKFESDLSTVVMRIEGSEKPLDYVRFFSYDTYNNGTWKRSLDQTLGVQREDTEIDNPDDQEELLVIENFVLNDDLYPLGNMKTKILPTSFLDQKIVPLSYDSVGVGLSVDVLDSYVDQSIQAKELSQATGIELIRNKNAQLNRLPMREEMLPDYKEVYSKVPEDLEMYLYAKSQELIKPTHDPLRAAQQLSLYFNKEYEYDLNFVSTIKSQLAHTDLVKLFLESERKMGHCELFATSTVLLLRSAGFQARYVSGSLVKEEADGGDYMITRAADLHAWVEVWDGKKNEWFVIDPTPSTAGAFPDYSPKGLAAFFESLAYKWQKFVSFILQGEITVVLATAFFAVYDPAKEFLSQPYNAVLSFFLLAFLFIWRQMRLRRKRQALGLLRADMLKINRYIYKLAKKYLPRPEAGSHDYMNLGEIAQGFKNIDKAETIVQGIYTYQAFRFGSMPEPVESRKLLKDFRHAAKSLQN